jgi:hypothetical protein
MMKGAFLASGIVALGGLSLHVFTMEHWIYPKLKESGFPSTPFGDALQMKKSFRMLWHFFTVNIVGTMAMDFIFYFTDWFPDPTPIARVLAYEWFAQIFVCFCIAHFSPPQLIKAFQWVILLAIGGLLFLGTL